MFCPNCGAQNPDNANVCMNCGNALQQQAPVQPMYQQPMYQQPMQPVAVPGKGLGVAGMILGILSLVFFCIPYIGFPLSVVSLILSIVGKAKAGSAGQSNGMAIAGLICSIISLALNLILLIIVLSGEDLLFAILMDEMF